MGTVSILLGRPLGLSMLQNRHKLSSHMSSTFDKWSSRGSQTEKLEMRWQPAY